MSAATVSHAAASTTGAATTAAPPLPASGYDVHIEELDEASPVADQPAGARITLKRHQLTLLARCLTFERERILLSGLPSLAGLQEYQPGDYMRTRIGILGDRAGSGKSFVILSLVLANAVCDEESSVRSYGFNRVVLCTRDVVSAKRCTLLVIPHNMCAQWEGYVRAFTDPATFRSRFVVSGKQLLSLQELNFDELDLVVVTCTCYNRLADFVNSRSVKFRRVVFDEVDNAQLPSCMAVDGAFTWFVTASFGNLLYPRGYSGWDTALSKFVWRATGLKNSGYIKNLFMDLYNSVSTDYVKVLVVKNRDEYVQTSIVLPPTHSLFVLCRTPASINLLHGVVDSAVIDSLNAGDVQSALQHVAPSNKNTEEHIVAVILDKIARQQQSAANRLAFAREPPEGTYESETDQGNDVARLQRRLDELTVKMDSIRARIRESETCCICYDGIEHKTITPCCSNSYCFRCINMWLVRSDKCPLCKQPIVSRDLFVVQPPPAQDSGQSGQSGQDSQSSSHNSQGEETHAANAASASLSSGISGVTGISGDSTVAGSLLQGLSDRYDKARNLEIILSRRTPASKFLIFASYDNSFVHIGQVLERLGMSYSYLKGNHDVVRNIVNRYKTGDLSVLLVNTRNYGSGLNLENTTDIIMFHKFDSEIEKQVVGRANRMGRTGPLNVYYLLYENEMQRAASSIGGVTPAGAHAQPGHGAGAHAREGRV